MELPSRIRLVVLFGGQSAEHEVSCTSAAQLLAAVDPDRYEVVPVGITKDGRWVLAEEARAAMQSGMKALPARLTVEGPSVEPGSVLVPAGDLPVVVLPLLHGPMGEDGTVQGMLELADLPFVGSGVLGSSVCMDKAMAKTVLTAHGVPQTAWRSLREHQVSPEALAEVVAALGLPLFVKPANMGSSVGVSKAATADELWASVQVALRYDDVVVIEEAVQAREIEVAVLGNETPRASVAGEIVPAKEFYDYEDKYVDDGAKLLVPAPLSDEDSDTVRRMAVEVYRHLRCDGLARIDFLFEEGRRGFLCNEANTMPGFTPISMYPMLWQATGVPYPDLVDELVRLAMDRHARRSARRRRA
jgi:D-alanine-D-alanine ligase